MDTFYSLLHDLVTLFAKLVLIFAFGLLVLTLKAVLLKMQRLPLVRQCLYAQLAHSTGWQPNSLPLPPATSLHKLLWRSHRLSSQPDGGEASNIRSAKRK